MDRYTLRSLRRLRGPLVRDPILCMIVPAHYTQQRLAEGGVVVRRFPLPPPQRIVEMDIAQAAPAHAPENPLEFREFVIRRWRYAETFLVPTTDVPRITAGAMERKMDCTVADQRLPGASLGEMSRFLRRLGYAPKRMRVSEIHRLYRRRAAKSRITLAMWCIGDYDHGNKLVMTCGDDTWWHLCCPLALPSNAAESP